MKTFVVCGLGFGDEGKGHTVAWLTRKLKATTIIRYNGGPQAAHHVVYKGRTHLFAQFGSGMAVRDELKTFLSRQMVIAPFNLLKEAAVHERNGIPQPLQRIMIDARCPVVTIWAKILNRAKEISRGAEALGTVGLGVGETFSYLRQYPDRVITAGDLVDTGPLSQKVEMLHQYTIRMLRNLPKSAALSKYLAGQSKHLNNPHSGLKALAKVGSKLAHCLIWPDQVDNFLAKTLASDVIIMEGAQGTLLDYERGTRPYVTKCCTRCCEANRLLRPYVDPDQVTYIGVSRPYAHRHGPGPLPTEEPRLESVLSDRHNLENRWQGRFRVGWFDVPLAAYARDLNPELDYLVITNLDRLSSLKNLKICTTYHTQQGPTEALTNFLFNVRPAYEDVANVQSLVNKIEQTYQLPILGISAGEENGWNVKYPDFIGG